MPPKKPRPEPKTTRRGPSTRATVSFATDDRMAAILAAMDDPDRFVREAILSRLVGGGQRPRTKARRST